MANPMQPIYFPKTPYHYGYNAYVKHQDKNNPYQYQRDTVVGENNYQEWEKVGMLFNYGYV